MRSSVACFVCGQTTNKGQCSLPFGEIPLCSVGCQHVAQPALTSANGGAALQLALRRLWTDHVHYTRELLLALATNAPNASVALDRLNRNQADIAEAVNGFWRDATAAKALKTLLLEHVSIAGELIAATAQNAPLESIRVRWRENAVRIRDLYVAQADVRARETHDGRTLQESGRAPVLCPTKLKNALLEHLVYTDLEVNAAVNRRWHDSQDRYDDVLTQAHALSDLLAGGFQQLWPREVTAFR